MQKRGSEREDGDKAQINVFIRARPLRSESSKKPLKFLDKGVALNYKEKIYQFHFDGIFDETVNQQKVFDIACLPIVKDVLAGNNAALFVYGQTGTGKTYTMGTL